MSRYEGGFIGNRPQWTSVYRTGIWTPQSVFHRQKQNLWSSSPDPYINNVVLHLKGDGVNGSTDIFDSSPSPLTVSNNGLVQISTAESKYGGSSIYFNNNGNLTVISSSLIFSGDFTIEAWCRFSTFANFDSPWSHLNVPLFFTYAGKYYFRNNTTELVTPTNHGLSLNVWTHIAISRGSGIVRIFNNGVEIISGTLTADYADETFLIGKMQTHFYSGYIDSLRVTRAARYTANFDPETDTYLNV